MGCERYNNKYFSLIGYNLASLHFTLMISVNYKIVYKCTAHENYISLSRSSNAAMSKFELTAKEGNLFHSLIALGKKTKFENISSSKRNVKVFIMHITGMS